MAEDTSLLTKQAALKQKLSTDLYRTLAKVVADWTGHIIQKLTRNEKPPPFWYNLTVIALVNLLLGCIISLFLGETYPLFEAILPGFLSLGFILAMVITSELFIDKSVFPVFKNYLLDAIESTSDLSDLEDRLGNIFSVQKQLFFGIIFSTTVHLSFIGYDILVANTTLLGSLGIGLIIFNMTLNILFGATYYVIFQYFLLVLQLGQFRIKLYGADPRNSEVIGHLADLLNNAVYIIAVFSAVLTFLLASFAERLPLPNLTVLAFIIWGPPIILFLSNQYALGKLIVAAKRKTLKEVQSQIEELQSREKIINEQTLDHIKNLMDYYDRISATRNSAINIRAGLSFLNSLLLPFIALLLANLEKIVQYLNLGGTPK